MKIHLPLLALVAISGTAFAQTEPATTPPAPAIQLPTAPAFPDVPRDHWAFAAVQRLAGAGIIQGYPATPKTATLAEVVPPMQEAIKTASVPVVVKAPVKAVKKMGTKKVVVGAKTKAAK